MSLFTSLQHSLRRHSTFTKNVSYKLLNDGRKSLVNCGIINMFVKVYNSNIDPNLMIKVVESLKKDEDIENFEILGNEY